MKHYYRSNALLLQNSRNKLHYYGILHQNYLHYFNNVAHNIYIPLSKPTV